MSIRKRKEIEKCLRTLMFLSCGGGVEVLMEQMLQLMQQNALRLMLAVAFVNACVLSSVALATKASAAPVQTGIAAGIALVIAAVPLLRGTDFAGDLTRAEWLPVAGGLLGAAALVVAPQSRSILFAALLTPVGVAVLADDRKAALLTTAVLIGGYVIAALEPPARSSLGVAVGDVGPAFAVILGGLVPSALASSTIKSRAAKVLEWRDATDRSPAHRKPGRPGIGREHDLAILEGVLAGRSNGMIAGQIGSTQTRVRDRIKVLAGERGVSTKQGLARVLAERELPAGAGGDHG